VKDWARTIKRDVHAVYLAARDPRTPWYAKALALCVAGYALSPIDLIPDFIPVLGYLDDAIIVPLGILAVVKMIPPEVMAEQPLETEIYDSVDKVDQGSAGNNPLDQMEQAVLMQQTEDMHQVQMAEATAKAGLAIKRMEQSDFRPKPAAGKK